MELFKETQENLEKIGAGITTQEIKQQPILWQEAFDNYKDQQGKIDQFIAAIVAENNKKIRVIFTGAGTSAYVGDSITPYLSNKGNRDNFTFESIPTTNIVSNPRDYLQEDQPTILVSFARSGNSPESVATVKLAKQLVKNLYQVTITCAKDGQLAQEAAGDKNNLLLLMPEKSNDLGFAMTGSFTCMLLSALLIFDTSSMKEKALFVQQVIKMGEEVITRESEIEHVLSGSFDRIAYLGSGSLAGLTREAQLKVLELTAGKITTIFDSSVGFRHGPKSFVNEKTLVFVFVSNDPYTRKYDLDIAEEIKADNIAAEIVTLDVEGKENFSGQRFTYEVGGELPEAYLVLPYVLFAQTIALHSSLNVENTPDTPSASGTVNRVVKGVNIYEYHN
ncbi:tagatose-6-phosphate ketose/aldose isomerase [Enterococcus sp. DIV0212c]|uniref:SIS domain-containing protein n=1 Tax=Enterococcus sp. DIV0212c TaxID=2230867 RepID=UPI001A9BF80C|nr:SIS domain-containing protein [Enterococcus sp. DIV0212c]MBO1353616.1 SIS domain-containing protein [Enterococcus sp. DIV0212c]